MAFEYRDDLKWTEHFVQFGFALRPGLVSHDWCDAALKRVRERIGNDLPLDEWTEQNAPTIHTPIYEGSVDVDPVLETHVSAWVQKDS